MVFACFLDSEMSKEWDGTLLKWKRTVRFLFQSCIQKINKNAIPKRNVTLKIHLVRVAFNSTCITKEKLSSVVFGIFCWKLIYSRKQILRLLYNFENEFLIFQFFIVVLFPFSSKYNYCISLLILFIYTNNKCGAHIKTIVKIPITNFKNYKLSTKLLFF